MDKTLLGVGLACIMAAIVGGGLKAFGVEIPLLKSLARQLILAAFGGILVVASQDRSAPEPTLRQPPPERSAPPGAPTPPQPPPINQACLREALNRLAAPQAFSRQNEVRCEGGGVEGNGERKSGVVAYSAPPGHEIAGEVAVKILSVNRGSNGPTSYKTEEGRTVGATVPISCASPNKTFGPGAWMSAQINGTVQKVPTKQQEAELENSCRL